MTHWGWKLWKYLKSEKSMDIIDKSCKYLKSEKSMAIIPETPVFPCADDTCLVRVSCKQACDKLIMDKDKLMEAFLQYNACPDCGTANFKEGPSGGMAQNVQCSGCGHYFNFALPLFIQRIHIDSNGRFQ